MVIPLAEGVAETDRQLLSLSLPGLHIFRGLRSPGLPGPPVAHGVAVGRSVVLIESVAWPPGRYSVAETGAVLCDGIRTGQSINYLRQAVGGWELGLSAAYRVSALVVIHGEGQILLPEAVERVCWVRSEDLVAWLAAMLDGYPLIGLRAISLLLDRTSRDG